MELIAPWDAKGNGLSVGHPEMQFVGRRVWRTMAFNPTLTTWAIIAPNDPATYPWPTVEVQPVVVSSDAQDKGEATAGTGARIVVVEYLDDDGAEHSETVTTNGVAEVQMDATDVHRINNFYVQTAGSGGVSAGNISLLHESGGDIIGYIAAGNNCDRCGRYTVPHAYDLYVNDMDISSSTGANKDALIALAANQRGAVFNREYEVVAQDAFFHIEFRIPLVYGQGTDVYWVGEAAGTSKVSIYADGWLQPARPVT